jgi:hypothetical protein
MSWGNYFVAKPVDTIDLIDRLEVMLSKNNYMRLSPRLFLLLKFIVFGTELHNSNSDAQRLRIILDKAVKPQRLKCYYG